MRKNEDPTSNVKDLNAASIEGISQLREADKEFNRAEDRHLREVIKIRAIYDEKIRIQEQKRIDENRASDSKLVEVQADRIRQLEKFQNRGEGKSGVTMPLMMAISTFIGALLVYVVQVVRR